MGLSPIEIEIRKQLGVPDDAQGVLVLGMDAHMDWDWLNTFQTLLDDGNGPPQGAVTQVYRRAWDLMSKQQDVPAYYYSVCEMGFLRAAIEADPSLLSEFRTKNLGRQLGLEGGGVTSPDNLLPQGEAFLRAYLVGQAWQRATLGLETTFAHLPDDFGHDAQLAVMIEALGFAAVTFARVPGGWATSQVDPLDGSPSLFAQLMDKANDFVWQASDGSAVLAHLMPASYAQGNPLREVQGDPAQAVALILGYWKENQPASPTPYVYVPCGNDFALPIDALVRQAGDWNHAEYDASGTYAVVATLDQYLRLVAAWAAANPGGVSARAADPTPYWTGFYASRPANKILHHAAVQALLGAEVYAAIASTLQTADAAGWRRVAAGRQATIASGWEAVLPSTHHDYITGTAVDSVTSEEQVPLLRAALAIALGARATGLASIAPMVGATPGAGEVPVAVANQLGFARAGVVAVAPPPGPAIQSVRLADGTTAPVQVGPDGWLWFPATAPAAGYTTAYLSTAAGPAATNPAWLTDDGKGTLTVGNGLLQAELTTERGGTILTFRPVVDGTPRHDVLPTDGYGAELVFFEDLGNLYNFGNELDSAGFTQVTGTVTPGSWTVRASGPWFVEAALPVAFDDGKGGTASYTIAYTLFAGEPFLRIEVTGAAPLPADPSNGGTPYAVCLRFPLADGGSQRTVDGIVRGTPYHWHDQLPVAYWQPPTFQATHHFAIASAEGQTLAAVYHRDVPAWAIDGSGALLACILRNTPGTWPWPNAPEGRGANGVDFATHRRAVALRVPVGLPAAPALLPVFQESLAYQVPLAAAIVNVPITGVETSHPVTVSFPPSYSLIAVTSDNAIVTAVKAPEDGGDALVVRLYQPSNGSADVTLAIPSASSDARLEPIDALERPTGGAAIAITDGTVTVTMNRALATYRIVPAPAGNGTSARPRGDGPVQARAPRG